MKDNRLLELFGARQTAVAGWKSIDSAYTAELVGSSGFDAVVIDCQHGMAGHAQMLAMLQALSHTAAVPLLRVSQNNRPRSTARSTRGPTASSAPSPIRQRKHAPSAVPAATRWAARKATDPSARRADCWWGCGLRPTRQPADAGAGAGDDRNPGRPAGV